MLRFSGATFVIVAIIIGLLAGCGGGGGSTAPTPVDPINDPITTPVSRNVTITGKIVSSADTTRGVAGVVVRLGALAYGFTNSTGVYSITFDPTVLELPYSVAVDTSGAGIAYPESGLVSVLDGQKYDPELVDVPVSILNGESTVMPTMVLTDITQSPPGDPYASKDSIIYGRVVKESDQSAVANVTVKLGNPDVPALTVKTGARGYFAFNIGRNKSLLDIVGTSATFSVDLTTSTVFDGSVSVSYGVSADAYFQNQSITISTDSDVPELTPTIGLVTVLDLTGGDDGGNPPPPPFFPTK